ncbi:MAG: hypothetical protein F6K56_16725 [Moorea sp. SIO3G5]|nr:hypothetical protein [Moorena sp. SIO3G5]
MLTHKKKYPDWVLLKLDAIVHNAKQASLTLPVLKERGFLDQRAALNRRVPIHEAAKNRTILNRESVQDQILS